MPRIQVDAGQNGVHTRKWENQIFTKRCTEYWKEPDVTNPLMLVIVRPLPCFAIVDGSQANLRLVASSFRFSCLPQDNLLIHCPRMFPLPSTLTPPCVPYYVASSTRLRRREVADTTTAYLRSLVQQGDG
jgi:hypothetical protein